MKIALASDIHTEFGGRDFDFPPADILLLAGDIGNTSDLRDCMWGTKASSEYREFLTTAAHIYKDVIYVNGNHEWYDSEINNSNVKEFLNYEKITNIHYGKGILTIGNYCFVYATLWTDFNKCNPQVMLSAQADMSDYRWINCDKKPINPYKIYEIHLEERKFIMDAVEKNRDKKCIIVTHHGPSISISNTGYPSILDYMYYCTNFDDFIFDNPNLEYWFHGHVHTRDSDCIGNAMIATNCRGYVGHEDTKGFSIRVLEI